MRNRFQNRYFETRPFVRVTAIDPELEAVVRRCLADHQRTAIGPKGELLAGNRTFVLEDGTVIYTRVSPRVVGDPLLLAEVYSPEEDEAAPLTYGFVLYPSSDDAVYGWGDPFTVNLPLGTVLASFDQAKIPQTLLDSIDGDLTVTRQEDQQAGEHYWKGENYDYVLSWRYYTDSGIWSNGVKVADKGVNAAAIYHDGGQAYLVYKRGINNRVVRYECEVTSDGIVTSVGSYAGYIRLRNAVQTMYPVNTFSPDGTKMLYRASGGIYTWDLTDATTWSSEYVERTTEYTSESEVATGTTGLPNNTTAWAQRKRKYVRWAYWDEDGTLLPLWVTITHRIDCTYEGPTLLHNGSFLVQQCNTGGVNCDSFPEIDITDFYEIHEVVTRTTHAKVEKGSETVLDKTLYSWTNDTLEHYVGSGGGGGFDGSLDKTLVYFDADEVEYVYPQAYNTNTYSFVINGFDLKNSTVSANAIHDKGTETSIANPFQADFWKMTFNSELVFNHTGLYDIESQDPDNWVPYPNFDTDSMVVKGLMEAPNLRCYGFAGGLLAVGYIEEEDGTDVWVNYLTGRDLESVLSISGEVNPRSIVKTEADYIGPIRLPTT